MKPAPRRTQAARRQETVRKLLDAAAEALIDVGYAATSVQEVCARAGVSHGGLFRHFATREALMIAVADDIGAQLIRRYQDAFLRQRRRGDAADLGTALALVRDTCRARLNLAWYELNLAARTSPGLRRQLAPLATRYYARIVALARQLLPAAALALGPQFDVIVETVLALYDGESLHRVLRKDAALEDARLTMLEALLSALVKNA